MVPMEITVVHHHDQVPSEDGSISVLSNEDGSSFSVVLAPCIAAVQDHCSEDTHTLHEVPEGVLQQPSLCRWGSQDVSQQSQKMPKRQCTIEEGGRLFGQKKQDDVLSTHTSTDNENGPPRPPLRSWEAPLPPAAATRDRFQGHKRVLAKSA